MDKKLMYHPPQLEEQPWQVVTGLSLPVGTLGMPENPLEALEEVETQ